MHRFWWWLWKIGSVSFFIWNDAKLPEDGDLNLSMRAELLSTWSGSDLIFFHTFVCSLSNPYDQDASYSNQFPSFFFLRVIKYNKTHCLSQETKLSSLVQSISHSFHVIQQFMVILRHRTPPPFSLLILNRKLSLRNPWVKQNNVMKSCVEHLMKVTIAFSKKPQCFCPFTSHFIYMLTAFFSNSCQ